MKHEADSSDKTNQLWGEPLFLFSPFMHDSVTGYGGDVLTSPEYYQMKKRRPAWLMDGRLPKAEFPDTGRNLGSGWKVFLSAAAMLSSWLPDLNPSTMLY